MSDPVLHVIAGPNGAGKSTFYAEVVGPVTHLEFVNADAIAADRWPDAVAEHAYNAAALAARERTWRIENRQSFATETVFSHESKIALLQEAKQADYLITLHIVLVPEELAVVRVLNRVANGGHHVPEDKIRARFGRLRGYLRPAIALVDDAYVYDNTRSDDPFRLIATYVNGHLTGTPHWPAWVPAELREVGR